MDYPFFKKPLSIDVPAPQKGWGAPSASSSPISKAPPKSLLDDLDTAKSMADLAVLIEDDDDDETFTPHKTGSSKSRGTPGSSKWWGSPHAKKAQTESPVSQKSKSCKVSHTSWDEREECGESRKEPEYRDALSYICPSYIVGAISL